MISKKTIERLSLYGRFLANLLEDGVENIYSHQLAGMAGLTAAIVRRDLMAVGYYGNPQQGYKIKALLKCIDDFFHAQETKNIILVGVGNLGRALLSYFSKGKTHLQIVAAFDKDPAKTNRVICNTHCYSIGHITEVLAQFPKIAVGIINVPDVEAQKVADILVHNGIKSLLNFAPVRLKVPQDVFVENVDITMMLEKAVYYSNLDNMDLSAGKIKHLKNL